VAREALDYTEERDREAVQAFAARLYREGYGNHPAVTAFFDAQRNFNEVLNDGWDVEEMLNDNDVDDGDVDKLVASINLPHVTKAYNEAAPARSEELREAEEAYGGQDFYMNYQDDFLHAAENLGYDGVMLTDPSPTGEAISYVVFSPRQVKSATKNAGTFDPSDPSILRNPRRSATTAERTDPALWEAVKREVTAGSKGGRPGQWSARKAQLAVALYKQRGGDYWGAKSPRNALVKWTREDWRTRSGKPSLVTGERYLPARAIAALTPAEYAATTRAKREGMRRGEQFTRQPERIAAKTARYRRNPVENVKNENVHLKGTYGSAEDVFFGLVQEQFADNAGIFLEQPEGASKRTLRAAANRRLRTLGIRPKARAYAIDFLTITQRGKGGGSSVVREIEQTLRDEGEEVVFLIAAHLFPDVPHSRGFWKRMGYTEVSGNYEPLVWEFGSDVEDDRIMFKVL